MNHNNFARRRETVILYQTPDMDEPQVISHANGEPYIFQNYFKAQAYVNEFADEDQIPHIKFVNKVPKIGGGDLEDTGGKKCLKCGTPVVPSDEISRQKVGEQIVQVEVFVCPKCDA